MLPPYRCGMIDTDHQARFIETWEKGDYRRGSTALRLVDRLLSWIPETATINDYGCGTGRADVEIHRRRHYQPITMIDITETALEDEARAIIETSQCTRFVEADLADLSAIPVADWGMCNNVLMTVQPDKLNKILSEIRRTCRNLVVEVYDWQDRRLGRDMTTVMMSRKEWHSKLAEYWPSVRDEDSPETARRFIFICGE